MILSRPKKNTLHKPFLFFLLTFYTITAYAQLFPEKNYPQHYFIYPVQARVGLAANFGELRPNHYHMGLDCRTGQVINKNVVAAADGYIAHVRVEPGGFGQAIYINHPNGLTTLYGHLNSFFSALADYVKEQQYKQESWKVFLNIPPGMFPVKKGQFIAKSGNTGGSMGPHCHFEIRDTKTDKVLNPLLFDFPIADKVPPTLIRLAMYDRCVSIYTQKPELFGLKRSAGDYTTITSVIPVHTDKVSFGISANDKLSGSANPNGIYQAVLYLDERPVVGFQLDSISYDETRYLNAHIDFRTREAGGPYIEHISRLPGYPEGVYKNFSGDGVIELKDDSVHQVRIEVQDPYGNSSTLKFRIKKGVIIEHGNNDSSSYHQSKEFHPGFVNIFENESLQLVLSPEDLYDSISFVHSKKESTAPNTYSDIHEVLSGLVPAHSYFTIRIKADKDVPPELQDNMLMIRKWKDETDVVKAERNGDWYTGKFREFGNFQLVADNSPPVITGGFSDHANLSHATRIVFVPKDNNDEIRNFNATLDGKWLMFSNDKHRAFIYHFDEMCPRGEHELTVSVEDAAGNSTQKTLHFTR